MCIPFLHKLIRLPIFCLAVGVWSVTAASNQAGEVPEIYDEIFINSVRESNRHVYRKVAPIWVFNGGYVSVNRQAKSFFLRIHPYATEALAIQAWNTENKVTPIKFTPELKWRKERKPAGNFFGIRDARWEARHYQFTDGDPRKKPFARGEEFQWRRGRFIFAVGHNKRVLRTTILKQAAEFRSEIEASGILWKSVPVTGIAKDSRGNPARRITMR